MKRGESADNRENFDDVLINHAISSGAQVKFGSPVSKVENGSTWKVSTNGETIQARYLVAADGRNSSVARLLTEYPKTRTDRVGLQTHFPANTEPHVTLQLCNFGYLGLATIGEGLTNAFRFAVLSTWNGSGKKQLSNSGLSPNIIGYRSPH